MKDVIFPRTIGVLDALKSNHDVSIFYKMLRKSQMTDIFKVNDIKKICFTKHKCVSITPSMLKQLEDAINFNQYSVIAPADRMFMNMTKSKLKSLMTDPIMRKRVFTRSCVFGISWKSTISSQRSCLFGISKTYGFDNDDEEECGDLDRR